MRSALTPRFWFFVAAFFLLSVVVAGIARGVGSVTDLLTVTGGQGAASVSSVSINNNQASITLTPNTTTNVNVNATVSDDNGCSPITGGTTTILLYRSGITSSTCFGAAGANPLNCYVANVFNASSTCSGSAVNTTTTFAVQYYAQATDPSSSFPNQNWMATVYFTDSGNATSSGDSTSATSTNEIATLVALNLPASLDYGTLFASSTSGSTNQLLNIENAGNASDTIAVNGTALTSGANSIATSSQHYATSSFTFGGGETALSDTATTITGINTAPVFNFPIGGVGWQDTQALPAGIRNTTAVAYNNYIYIVGGQTPSVATATVLFAPINATGSIGAWTSTQALPNQIENEASVVYNGYLYVLGGCTSSCGVITSTVLFAPINSTGSIGAWTSTQALPTGTSDFASVVYNGYLYKIGGQTLSTVTSSVFFAPINSTGSIGAWTSTQALPNTLRRLPSVAYNGYLYTIGGNDGSFGVKTVYFAPINSTGSIGAWTSTQALPKSNYYQGSAVYNGYLYSLGGCADDCSPTPTSTVLFAPINATGSIGAWSSTQALPNVIENQGSAVYNGYLYTIGGLIYPAAQTIASTTFTPLNARSTYWGVTVPSTVPTGNYTAVTTFIAAFSQ